MAQLIAAGSGHSAWPRRSVLSAMTGVAGVIVVALVACGGPDGSTSPVDDSATSADSSGSATSSAGAGSGSSDGTPAAALARIEGVDLQVASYEVAGVLDDEGGAELRTMLDALDLEPVEVSLVVAVDPDGRLAIGHWGLPGRDAAAIREAWEAAAPDGWRSATLAGESALTGRGADGSIAWALARDGVFLYVVSENETLAEAAAAAITR